MEWLKPNFSFILGSGFSRALHSAMPVTSHLGEEVSEMEAIKEAGLSSLGKYDVEALLSYCFSFYPWFSESEYHSRRSLFSNLVEKIRRIIVESESNFIVKNTPEYISNLFEFWKERKIIISTFNYDTIFEKIAMKAESDKKSYNDLYKLPMQDVFDRFSGGMFGGGPPNTKQSTLAKLHGSINWYYDGSFDDQSGQIFLGPASLDKQNLFF